MIPDESLNIPDPRLSNALDDGIPRQKNDKIVQRLTTARAAKTPTIPQSKDDSLPIGLQTPDVGIENQYQTPINIDVQLTHINDNVPLTPMIDIPDPGQQDFALPAAHTEVEVAAFDGTMMTPVAQQSESRREMFERLANEIGDKLKQKRTPRKKPRRVARPQQVQSEFLELNQPRIFRKRKAKAVQVRMPEPALNMIMDVFEDLDDYDHDDVPDYQDDEPVLPAEIQPVLESMTVNQDQRQNQKTATMTSLSVTPHQPMLPHFDDDIMNLNENTLQDQDAPSDLQPPPIQSPDASFINKRPRMTLSNDAQISELNIPVPSRDITAATPAMKDITAETPVLRDITNNMSNIETPHEPLFQPVNTSTVLQKPRSGIHRITEAEIEYAKLKFISEHNMRKVDAQKPPTETLQSALAPPPDETPEVSFVPETEGAVGGISRDPGTHEDGRVMFRRFEKNGEWMIEFVGVNGTKEEYSEYCLEVIKLFNSISRVFNNLTKFISDNRVVLANSHHHEAARIMENEVRRAPTNVEPAQARHTSRHRKSRLVHSRRGICKADIHR
jgi:hypothetical protein